MHTVVSAPNFFGLVLAILEKVVDVRRLVVPAEDPFLDRQALTR